MWNLILYFKNNAYIEMFLRPKLLLYKLKQFVVH